MKNKKNIYLLLAVVLAIWGLVIYQFFSFAPSEAIEQVPSTNLRVKPFAVKPRDTIAINVNYRDPFLGKAYLPENPNVNKGGKRKKAIEKAPLVWPPISYKGIVSDSKDKKKVFMVIINGQTYLMREKQTEQEITLKNGNRDFIGVIYRGATNKILIQQ